MMTRLCAIFLLLTTGCAGTYMASLDAGPVPTDAPPDARYAGCEQVAAAYEAARARFGCSYDWPNCPVTISNDECVQMFAGTVSCGHLDTIASRCSL